MRIIKMCSTAVVLVLSLMWLAVPVQAAGEQVFDQADLLSEQEEAELEQRAGELKDAYQMNIVLVTTDDAAGKSARKYADDFYMDNGFYNNDEKGGALFLIDMDNREVYVSVSGDLMTYLTDNKQERVINAGYDSVADGDYADSFRKMLDQTEEYLVSGIDSNQYLYDQETGKITRYRSLTLVEVGIALVAALAAAGIAGAAVIGKYRLKWGSYRYPFKEKSSLDLTVSNDHFRNQIVTTRRIPKNPPPSGGGGGGGRTTTHTSSGGGSFSGSGRKF